MHALINTTVKAKWISSWTYEIDKDGGRGYTPHTSDLDNSCMIYQIESATFDVHPDNIWVECNSTVTTKDFYYEPSTQTIKPLPVADKPE